MDDYKIIEAYFEKDAQSGQYPSEVSVSVAWTVQVESDIKVFLAYNGQIVVWDSWTWNSATSRVTLSNTPTDHSFSVYILRAEQAVMLAELVAKKTVTVDAILLQLQKNVRSLEQFEAVEKTSIRGLDKIGLLPNAENRAGKTLGFDEFGNPQMYTGVGELLQLKNETLEAKDIAVESARKISSGLDDTFNGYIEDAKNNINNWSDQAQRLALIDKAIEAEKQKFIPFDSVAQMKVSPILKAGSYATTLGYHSANDGGGAEYVIVDDANLLDDGGSVIAIGNGSLRAKLIIKNNVINIRHWGAKSDYISPSSYTDSSANFLNAVNYISQNSSKDFTLYLPTGKFAITETINVPPNCNVQFDGAIYFIADENLYAPVLSLINHRNKNIFIYSVICVGDSLDIWTNGTDYFAGVELIGMIRSTITIGYVENFAVGVRCVGEVQGFTENRVNVRELRNSRTNLLIVKPTTSDKYINANLFEGGCVCCYFKDSNDSSLPSISAPYGFTGVGYGIKIETESSSSNIFRNFDITGSSTPSSATYTKHQVYIAGAKNYRFESFRWEYGEDSDKCHGISLYCGDEVLPQSYSAAPYSNVFTPPTYPSKTPTINYINTQCTRISLPEMCKAEENEKNFREIVRFNLYRNKMGITPHSDGLRVSVAYRGVLASLQASGDREYNLNQCAKFVGSRVYYSYIYPEIERIRTDTSTSPAFLFRLQKPNANFKIKGNGSFYNLLRLFDANGNPLLGAVVLSIPVQVDGVDYGIFEGSFAVNAVGWGKGVVTPNDTSIQAFEVWCDGTTNSEIEVGDRVWRNASAVGDASISGTFTGDVTVLRRRVGANFYFDGHLIFNGNASEKDFTILEPDAKYAILNCRTSPATAQSMDSVANEISIESDSAEFIQYPDDWAPLRGMNEFFSTTKPTSVSSTEFPIMDGQRVYDTTAENFGKYWEYISSTSTWSDLRSAGV